jgi:hypothetical protein
VADDFGFKSLITNSLNSAKEISLISCSTAPRSDLVILLIKSVLILLKRLAIERL